MTPSPTRFGDVQVQITVENGKVTTSSVTQVPWSNGRDQEINSYAVPILNSEAVDAQSASIDMVSGCHVHLAGLHRLAAVGDRPGEPVITAEIPVLPSGIAPPRLARRAWVEHVMGMPVSVHVRAVDPTRPDLTDGVARVYAHLRKVDAVLSTWRADSDLLRLQHGEHEEAHPWVADVTELCLEAEERTDGLFQAWQGGGAPAAGWRTTPPVS